MNKYVLYGDGIHDDTDAIQELIDSGVCEVINHFDVHDVTLENHTDKYCSKFKNYGRIEKLYLKGMDPDEIENEGTIGELICNNPIN